MEEAKSNLMGSLFTAVGIAAIGGVICHSEVFKGSGLDVGIAAGSILGALSMFLGKKMRRLPEEWHSM